MPFKSWKTAPIDAVWGVAVIVGVLDGVTGTVGVLVTTGVIVAVVVAVADDVAVDVGVPVAVGETDAGGPEPTTTDPFAVFG